jgi:hypothetical protein
MSRNKERSADKSLELIREIVKLVLSESDIILEVFKEPPKTVDQANSLLKLLKYDVISATSGNAQQVSQGSQAEELIRQIDLDSDGTINEKELEEIVKKWNEISGKLSSIFGFRIQKVRSSSPPPVEPKEPQTSAERGMKARALAARKKREQERKSVEAIQKDILNKYIHKP